MSNPTQAEFEEASSIRRPSAPHRAQHNEVTQVRIQREGPSSGRYYIEVADDEGGTYRPDPVFMHMFIDEEMAGKAAEHALQRFPVARICEEKMVFRKIND